MGVLAFSLMGKRQAAQCERGELLGNSDDDGCNREAHFGRSFVLSFVRTGQPTNGRRRMVFFCKLMRAAGRGWGFCIKYKYIKIQVFGRVWEGWLKGGSSSLRFHYERRFFFVSSVGMMVG